MLWILLPLMAVMALAGDPIMMIYGSTFRMGGTWLGILAVGLATNAFVTLGETAIMVQQPRLNLINSSVAAAVAVGANVWLIPRFGVTGAAIGVLLPFAVQGVLRYAALKLIFRWQNPWTNISPQIIAAAVAIVPALICHGLLRGLLGQILAAAVFLAVFGLGWMYHLRFRRRLDFEQSRL
jgi:O-antigen/teichoic acid export membrane protein